MHTSTTLRSEYFGYFGLDRTGESRIGFGDFCADYHVQDRIGVVCPSLEDGILSTAYALLACTTAFYDVLRRRVADFFDYPQHFCILNIEEGRINTRHGWLQLDLPIVGAPWGNLDVWPECKWKSAAGNARAMIQQVLDLQIDRLFWPEGFATEPETATPLANVEHMLAMKRMLATHLKQVYYYNSARPTIQVRVARAVEDIVSASIDCIPGIDQADATQIKLARRRQRLHGDLPYRESYRIVSVQEFLQTYSHVFEPG